MKKKKKNNNKRIIIITVIIIVFILFIIALLVSSMKKKSQGIDTTINNKFTSIEDIIKFYECDYYKETKSKDDDYEKDIYVSFKYNLFDNNESKENYFKMIIESIVIFNGFDNFRLIDEDKNIEIGVICDQKSETITSIYYNGDTDYFLKELSKKSFNNKIDQDEISANIDSEILKECINQNWISRNIGFGTQESTFNKYNVYFDEGYKVRTIQGKLYNLVFTKKYQNSIINGIRVGDNFNSIKSKLGNDYIEENGLLEYKTNNYYIIFSSDEVSVYPNINYDTDKFENLVEEYKQSNDIRDFMDKLTDLWPDYDKYTYDTNYLEITYSLKGVKISYNIDDKNGIQIYGNYNGEYVENKTDNEKIIYQLNKNLLLESEENRILQCDDIQNPESNKEKMKYSSKFALTLFNTADNGNYINVKIISLDGEYPNNEFDENQEITDYIWINDYMLIYSEKNGGIYLYNAVTRENQVIEEGENDYKIIEFDPVNNTLKYDEKQVKINY